MLLSEAQKYLEVVSKRGQAEAELRRVYYNIATNRELFLKAYVNLYANQGAMTPGVHPEDTVDRMSLERIDTIMEKLQRREYVWQPVRRIYIPKRDGVSKRALGMPGWTDKLLQEVIRLILSAYKQHLAKSRSREQAIALYKTTSKRSTRNTTNSLQECSQRSVNCVEVRRMFRPTIYGNLQI
jgi:hypothetical protein